VTRTWRRRLGVTTAVAAVLLATAACAPGYRSEAIAGPVDVTDPLVAAGQRAFARHCHACHPGARAGLGPSIVPIPALIRLQVRHGFGAMPAFPEDRLSDSDLEALVAYLMARHAHGRAALGS
jgi:mono/diheme cytochrome c family protein